MPDASGLGARAARLSAWGEPVSAVRHVDAGRVKKLANIGIARVGDLVRHYPHRYIDVTETPRIADLSPGTDATVIGRVHATTVKNPRRGLTVVEVAIVDGTGVLFGVWFNQPYIAERFREGERVAFAGKVGISGGFKQIRNPLTETLGDSEESETLGRLIPVHPATEGLSSGWMRRLTTEALSAFGDVPDFLPARIRARHRLMNRAAALRAMHAPEDMDEAHEARRRIAYEEFFLLQLVLAERRASYAHSGSSMIHTVDGPLRSQLEEAIPFSLTDDQRAAIDDIASDMSAASPMHRLLLGDVGTGKTAVAAVALAIAADSNTQAAMMAPTEVLAGQYSRRVGPLLDAAKVSWAMLTGSTPARERKEILSGLASGALQVALGTHALFSRDVRFARLGLIVVDEQHRFGVEQRAALREKGEAPDVLVMTATPIPRSLALTLHGELDTSYLRQRPTGRSIEESVSTRVIGSSERSVAYEAIRKAVAAGRQAYVVCPLVEESESLDTKAATDEADRLSRDVFPNLEVALLTGRTPQAEKDEVMGRFVEGSIDVLVATTVVEVGVDVPNATVLLIEGAERFGLAQLHQLRGRVARGAAPGEAYLLADPKTDESRRRMAAVANISDGFELAEVDLSLRGEGEILGARQSGMSALRVASVPRDIAILEAARRDVTDLGAREPTFWSRPPRALMPAIIAARADSLDSAGAGAAG